VQGREGGKERRVGGWAYIICRIVVLDKPAKLKRSWLPDSGLEDVISSQENSNKKYFRF
jgi:hypothetical protein